MRRAAAGRVRTALLLAGLLAAAWAIPQGGTLAAQVLPGLQPAAGEGAGEEGGRAADRAEEGVAEAEETADEGATEPLPPVSELVPRVLATREEARTALATVRELSEVAVVEERADELAAALATLTERLDQALAQEYVSDDRVAAIVEQAAHEGRRAVDVMKAASARVEELDALRRQWRTRLETWHRWRGVLVDDPQFGAVYAEQLESVFQAVEGVLAAADGALPELVRLQEELLATDAGLRRVAESGQAVLRTWRGDLFERSTPVLLSAAHRQAVGAGALAAARRGAAEALAVRPGAWRGVDGRLLAVVLAQLGLIVLLGWGLGRLRPRLPEGSRWAEILGRPWAIGVLVAGTSLGLLYGPAPPLLRFAAQAAVAAAASLVAGRMFRNPHKRRVVYLLALAFTLFAALEAVALPVPLLRLVLAAFALGGAAVLVLFARSTARSSWQGQRWFTAFLRLGAVVLLAVFVAEVPGYHFLAQWLAEAAVATVFVGFVVTFLLRLGRGGLYLALRSEAAHRVDWVARVGNVLFDRLALLLKVVLVLYGVLLVASIWDLADSPGAAWRALVGAGISFGERKLTVGNVLVAAFAVYLAVLASWVVRSLLDRAVFERREFERGVKESIFTLLHYALLVLGTFLALTLFGVDLSSLALIAGALSVGIGFGLQNVVNNFVSGLILLFERPVRVGDVVVLGEEWGTITKIGLRSTVLTTFNGSELIVPNADLISEKVVNWTLTTPKARLVLPVGVAYGNDPQRVIAVLEEVAGGYELALAEPAPMAIFTGFGASSLDFELRVWLAAFDQLLRARSELAGAVTRRFAEEGIQIPFPQRDLHLKSAPGLEVWSGGAWDTLGGGRPEPPTPPPASGAQGDPDEPSEEPTEP